MAQTEFSRITGSYSTAFIGKWEQIGQSVSGNYTTIRLYGYFYYGGGTQVNSSYSTFKLNNKTVSTGSYSHNPGTYLLGTTDVKVTHNADGTFPNTTVSISANSWHMSGTKSATIKSSQIARIPRASAFTVSPVSGTVGDTLTVKITPAASGLQHQVKLSMTGGTTQTSTLGSDTTVSMTIPSAWAGLITAGTSGTATVTVDTYSGSTKIGEKSKNITVTVPDTPAFAPSFTTGMTVDDYGSAQAATWGVLVQGLASITLKAISPTAQSGASLASVTFDGVEGTVSGSDYVLTVSPVNASRTVKVRATDSRGLYTEQDLTYAVFPYEPPSLSGVEVFRCDQNGDANANGAYVSVTATGRCSPVDDLNTVGVVAAYREKGTQQWSAITVVSGTEIIGGALLSTKAYEVLVRASDLLGGVYDRIVTVSTGNVVFHAHPSGAGVGIGRYCGTSGNFEVAYPAFFDGTLDTGAMPTVNSNPIADSGSGANGAWIRFADGTQICTKEITSSSAIATADGSLYSSGAVSLGDWAQEFTAAPTVSVSVSGTECFPGSVTGYSRTSAGSVKLYRPQAISSGVSAVIHLIAFGRWPVIS